MCDEILSTGLTVHQAPRRASIAAFFILSDDDNNLVVSVIQFLEL